MSVAVLLNAGDQVPVIPSKEVVGNVKEVPKHIGSTAAKDGVTIGETVNTAGVRQVPPGN